MERRKYFFGFIFMAAYFGFLIYFCYVKTGFFNEIKFDPQDMPLLMKQLFIGGSVLMVAGALLSVLTPHLRLFIMIGLLAQVVGQSYLVFKEPSFFLTFYQEGTLALLVDNVVVAKVLSYVFIGTIYLMQLTIFLSLLHVLRKLILPIFVVLASMAEVIVLIVSFAKAYGTVDFQTVMQMVWIDLQGTPLLLLFYPLFTLFIGFASDSYHAQKSYDLGKY